MSPTDPRLDADRRYATDGGRLVEANAARILDLYPNAHVARTRDVIQIDIRTDADEARGVTVLVTPEAYELRLPTVEWTAGPYGPAASSRYLKRVRARTAEGQALDELLGDAIARRDAEFVPCRYCGRPTAPEHRHRDTCHGCTEHHLGVIH